MSGNGEQVLAEGIPIHGTSPFNFFVRSLPHWEGARKQGPAFLATDNFSVLKLYNNSDVYAIFVGHVADMIATKEPVQFVGAWAPVERFTRDRIQRFQEVLVTQGYDVGKVDGLAGFKTRAAIGLQ